MQTERKMTEEDKKFAEKIINSIEKIIERQPDQVNAMMKPELVDCNVDEKWAKLRYKVLDWELNLADQLHGGVSASMFDFSFGVITRNIHDAKFVSTVELSVTYMRPVDCGENVIVKVQVEHAGRKLTHVTGELYAEKTGKTAAIARAIFFYEKPDSQK